MNKYEQLIEHIINDEEDKARALFHDIVVEKSRDIYESLMDEEYTEEDIGGSQVESMMDEVTMDENGGIEEGEDDSMDMGDEMVVGMDDEGDMGDEDLEQKVMDLEDELEALKAEFEALMGGEEGEEEHSDMDMGDMGDMGSDDEESDKDEEMMEEMIEETEEVVESVQRRPLQKTAVDLMREYVEKVASPSNTEGADNKSSVVAGKNDMGGTAKNLAQGASESAPDGTSAPKKGNVKDVKDANNWENKPGANAGDAFASKAKAKTGEEGGVNKDSIESGGN